MTLTQTEQLLKWGAFGRRVYVNLPFKVVVFVRPDPRHDERAETGVTLHVPDRDADHVAPPGSPGLITVDTHRPCGLWTNDDDALEMLFDLLSIALTHETRESVYLDSKRIRDPHRSRENALTVENVHAIAAGVPAAAPLPHPLSRHDRMGQTMLAVADAVQGLTSEEATRVFAAVKILIS